MLTTLFQPGCILPARQARARRRIGIALQALGWVCGLCIILCAPMLPLFALLLLPIAAMVGFSEPGGAVMVLAFVLLFAMLPLSLILVHFGDELKTSPMVDRICHVCGYDLRGSAHSRRCSECGSDI